MLIAVDKNTIAHVQIQSTLNTLYKNVAVTALTNKIRVQSQKIRKHNINERTLPVTQRFFSRPAGDFAQLQSTNQICRWISCYCNYY